MVCWDIHKEILVFGETKTIVAFLKDYFGFHHKHLTLVLALPQEDGDGAC